MTPGGGGLAIALGTDDGVWILENGRCAPSLLRGAEVSHISIRNGTILAAVPRDGLYRVTKHKVDLIWKGDARACAIGFQGTYYLGIEPAMVYRSDDQGENWVRLSQIDKLPTRNNWYFPPPPHEPHVRSIDFLDGNDGNVIVGIEVGGVLISSNYGETWEELNCGIDIDVHTVRPDPGNSDHLIAVTGGGVYISEDQGLLWTNVTEGLSQGYAVGLHIKPDSTGEVLLTTGEKPPGLNAQLYHSRNGGKSWNRLEPPELPNHYNRVPVVLFAEGCAWVATDQGEVFKAHDVLGPWEFVCKIPSVIYTASHEGSPSSVSSGFRG